MKKKKLPFLKKALRNVNETTMAISKFGIEQQELMTGGAKTTWQKVLKMVVMYGIAIGIGIIWGFFYGIMTLCLVGFIYNVIENRV